MPGNSKRSRAGPQRAGGNPSAGSGGRRKRGLEGKGPTPKAVERKGHKAFESPKASPSRPAAKRSGGRSSSSAPADWVAGRNAVVEALQARVPVTSLYIA